MHLSKTTEYALRILSFMASDDQNLYSSEYLYEKLKIPRRYLRRLLTELSKAGLLSGARGREGGFTFQRDPDTITLMEIIDLMEGKEGMNQCILGFALCVSGGKCKLHDQWSVARTQMSEVLKMNTLGSLKNRPASI
jgi:Rrf2 family protein